MTDRIPYLPVGRCIYCDATTPVEGASRFGDEHINPFGFGGQLVLPEASCRRCEKIINSQIETPIINKEWGDLRIRRKFPSRNNSGKRKQKRRTHIRIKMVGNLYQDIPIEDHPTPVPIYKFQVAKLLSGNPEALSGNWSVSMLGDHKQEADTRNKYPGWSGQHSIEIRADRFGRFIAKIAHSYAAAEWGIDNYFPTLQRIILGRGDGLSECFTFIGSSFEDAPFRDTGGHHFDMHLVCMNKTTFLLVVYIRMFGDLSLPEYHAVVGIVDLNNEKHVATLNKHILDGKIEKLPLNLAQVPPASVIGGV